MWTWDQDAVSQGAANKQDTYIVPRHPRTLQARERIAGVVVHVLEVHDARIIVILPGEHGERKIGRVHVCEGVRVRVPAAKAEVESADTRVVVVDDDDLLVVRPEFDGI
jgi:hypothetical protein